MEDKVEGTLITLTDDCLRAVCLHLDALADIISFSKVNHQFRQAAIYRLSHMSFTLAIEENVREDETVVWTYVLRDMANNSFTVLKPFALQQNTALVQGVRRIEISLVIRKRTPIAILLELCEPFFPNLFSLQISSYRFNFDDSDQECFCNALCAMPKLVDVSLKGYLYWNYVIKLTENLQSRNACNVFSAFKAFNLRRSYGVDMPDIINAIALYPNVEEVDIPGNDLFPSPNNVDFTPFQNLRKLKSLSTSIGRSLVSDLDPICLIPAHLTMTDLKLQFYKACAKYSIAAQYLSACRSLKVFKLTPPTYYDACTFPQFLTAFESHRNLMSLDLIYEDADAHMPTKDVYEHIHAHFLELAARAPESLCRMHLALTPHKTMRVNEEMARWASVIKVSRTPTVHITFGLDFEQGLRLRLRRYLGFPLRLSELTSAMEQSLVNELILNVEVDTMDGRVGTRTTIDGTRQGSTDLFRIGVTWTSRENGIQNML